MVYPKNRGETMRTLVVCVLFLGAIAPTVAQLDWQNNAALQKRITVWLRISSLSEVLREIGQQVGVPLRSQEALRETKLVVYVENRPAYEILERIATLFGYRWRRDEDGRYVLYLPDETRRALEEAQKQDLQATERALRDLLRITAEWLQLPPDKRAEAMANAPTLKTYPGRIPFEQIALAEIMADEEPDPEKQARARVALFLSSYNPQGESPKPQRTFGGDTEGSLLHCLAESGESVVRMLLEGRTLGFSTRPAPGVMPLPSRVLLPREVRRPDEQFDPETSTYIETQPPSNPEWGGFWVRLSAWGDALEYELIWLGVDEIDGKQQKFLNTDEGSVYLPVSDYLRQTDIWRQWSQWETPPAKWRELLKARRPLSRAKPETQPEKPILAAGALEWIAWHTGYPVISDASRYVGAPYRNSLNSPLTLLMLLRRDLWLRLDEAGYLLARHKRFWKLNQCEIPERVLRPLEAKWLAWKWLSLDDYASVAASITDAQARGFTRMRRSYQLYAAFDTLPLYYSLPALRFWASLSSLQRQRARKGEWIPESTLTLPQRRRFRDALYREFPLPERLLRDLPQDYTSGLYLSESFGDLPSYSHEALRQAPDIPAFRALVGMPVHELSVLMGESPTGGRMYTLHRVSIGVSKEGVDWEKVFKQAGFEGPAGNAILKTDMDYVLQFSLPPRLFQQCVVGQGRYAEFTVNAVISLSERLLDRPYRGDSPYFVYPSGCFRNQR
jgi:hypothetical protein